MNETIMTQGDVLTDEPLRGIEESLARFPDGVAEASRTLHDVAHAAQDASQADLAHCASVFASLLEIVVDSCSEGESNPTGETQPVMDFVVDKLPALRRAFQGLTEDDIEAIAREAEERWGDWIHLIDGEDSGLGPDSANNWEGGEWESSCSNDDRESSDAAEPSDSEINLLLSAIRPGVGNAPVAPLSDDPGPAPAPAPRPEPAPAPPPMESGENAELDSELLEAFLDDAQRCLASMEAAALAFEGNPQSQQPLIQICRELHTLKGASASVGLKGVASYLHEAEDTVQESCRDESQLADVQFILSTVDEVRNRIAAATGQNPTGENTDSASPAAGPASATSQSGFEDAAPFLEETIRVKANQLDRLLDLLAQLVMLRNGRDSGVARLKGIHSELTGCVHRLRLMSDGIAREQTEMPPKLQQASPGEGATYGTEIANDVIEIARGLRELYEPIAQDNLAVSHFIRQFRQELMQLSRMPIGGLFRRLQRSVRDAARVEEKQVHLKLVGEHVGLDRSLQERLYEPLLHIVRNAVSHGIESPSQRSNTGKNPTGTITLEARGGTNLLVIEVRDDGKGLDYEAIRRRGVERGLLASDRPATREELAQLIFQPGFSTRQGAGEVAGRGVGMDVVAGTLDRMRSWVEVESTPGQGSCIRLSIPLRSVIEHAMVFRAAGQLFGMPLQFVHSAGDWQGDTQLREFTPVAFTRLFGMPPSSTPSPQALILEGGRRASAGDGNGIQTSQPRRTALLVDEIIGPEEVVVRPLPPLLRNQPIFAGLTLSSTGETVLLLDSQRLSELASARPTIERLDRPERAVSEPANAVQTFLVVDDSLSARKCLTKALHKWGYQTVEAADGLEAMERVESSSFTAVFSDLEMPRQDGFGLLHDIKSDERFRHLPVVIVSSRHEQEYRQRARELGAFAYLTKPFDEATLSATIGKLPVEQRKEG